MAEDIGTTGRLVRGAAAGLVAGLVASFAMDAFQAAVSALSSDGGDDAPPATVTAARKAAHAVGTDIPEADRPLAGQLVHYALGAGLGIGYGLAAEFRPAVTGGFGTAFGAGTAALLDEAMVPAVGLGSAPWRTPPATHLYGLASHLIFGTVAELVRRQMRESLSPAD